MNLSLEPIKKIINSSDVKLSEKEFDENFNSVTTYMERGEYSAAIPLIESSFKSGACDIRLVMFYLYVHIHNVGIKCFEEVIPFLNQILTKDWEKLSPTTKRDQHAQKSFSWFFTRLNKSFEKAHHSYKNKKMVPLKTLTQGVSFEMLEPIKESVLELNKRLGEKWDNQTIGNQLLKVQKWTVDLSQIAISSKEPAKSEPVEEVSEPVEPEPEEMEAEEVFKVPLEVLEPSKEMEQLYAKIEAFQALIEGGKYPKAAIVAEDIDARLESFNPAAYFPKLFVKYYSHYAKYAAKIEEEKTRSNAPLKKLYHTDLDTFMDW